MPLVLPKPYYERGGITIYLGDCRDVLPCVAADVLITDPPYGVRLGDYDVGKNGYGAKHGLYVPAYASYEDSYANYLSVVCPAIRTAITMTRRAAVFTGPHIWDLPEAEAIGGVFCPSAQGRHKWGFKTFLPVLLYGTAPGLQHGAKVPNVLHSTATVEPNGHPCPKPIEWMRWLVSLASAADEIVLDPFMGSGTTLRAAKDLGRRAIGIELEERYCEIAVRRLAQDVLLTA